MKATILCVAVLASLLLLTAGCQSSEDVVAEPVTSVAIETSPVGAGVEEPIEFFVTAHNGGLALTTVSIDFTGDGTYDETHSVSANDVEATFTHTYSVVAQYAVTVEVNDANDHPTVKTQLLKVGAVRNVPVSYLMLGTGTEAGMCSAHGAPAYCPSCSVPLTSDPATTARRYLGMYAHGTVIQISQGFTQWPFAGGQDIPYSCSFELRLVVGVPPFERPFGVSTCTTDSSLPQAVLTCAAMSSGYVP
jgi:hypothetical protein